MANRVSITDDAGTAWDWLFLAMICKELDAPTVNGFPGTGTVTISAANGDQVTFKFSGFLNPYTGEGAGPLEITGGTGRFAGATGTGTFYAVIDLSTPANQSMTVLLDGIIRY